MERSLRITEPWTGWAGRDPQPLCAPLLSCPSTALSTSRNGASTLLKAAEPSPHRLWGNDFPFISDPNLSSFTLKPSPCPVPTADCMEPRQAEPMQAEPGPAGSIAELCARHAEPAGGGEQVIEALCAQAAGTGPRAPICSLPMSRGAAHPPSAVPTSRPVPQRPSPEQQQNNPAFIRTPAAPRRAGRGRGSNPPGGGCGADGVQGCSAPGRGGESPSGNRRCFELEGSCRIRVV